MLHVKLHIDELIIILNCIFHNHRHGSGPCMFHSAKHTVRCTSNRANKRERAWTATKKKLNHLIIHFTVYKRTTSGACFMKLKYFHVCLLNLFFPLSSSPPSPSLFSTLLRFFRPSTSSSSLSRLSWITSKRVDRVRNILVHFLWLIVLLA